MRARLAGLASAARGELHGPAAVLAMVLAVTSFRIVYALGGWGPIDLPGTLRFFLADAVPYLALALLVYIVVQQVRQRGPQRGWKRAVVLTIAVIGASVAAAALRSGYVTLLEAPYAPVLETPPSVPPDSSGNVGPLFADSPEDPLTRFWDNIATLTLRFLVPAAMLLATAEFLRRERISLEAMHAAEDARQVLETQTLRARLRTLEAQIEPHFLFNTLANVRRLYETDVDAGEAMMGRLLEYLRMALPSMRGDTVTLGREAELVRAYLELQKVRMGRRLLYAIDVPPSLAQLRLPPMMLLTLVENAIKHGLAPERDGGRIDVVATLERTVLRVEVRDTGRGFGGQTSGGGTGLANIRARLAASFGDAAAVSLVPRQPAGLVAVLTLPAVADEPKLAAPPERVAT